MHRDPEKQAGRSQCRGYVYILTSPGSPYLKIGGSQFPPLKRVREINTVEPYRSLGPWTLVDFRQVSDWRGVEHQLHRLFGMHRVRTIDNQRELFELNPQVASRELASLDESLLTGVSTLARLLVDSDHKLFLGMLFSHAGLFHWLDLQGGWTLSLFPRTSGGRFHTLSIGRHEVAFSHVNREASLPGHMLLMDRLVLDFDAVKHWLEEHNGSIHPAPYGTALERAVSVVFTSTFSEAQSFLALDGVRRAVLAYWSEALIRLAEKGVLSPYARYHQGNAVAMLYREHLLTPFFPTRKILARPNP